jgi:8-oxo-dGTP pyrophosphatase MutT (NUDIX family)
VHRKPLLGLINDYLRRFPDEQETARRLLDFVAANPDCFRRELLAGHVTGSAWLLDRSLQRALLTHHRKLNRWLQPGGHADGDPDVMAVAMREATEESGLGGIEPVMTEIFDLDIHEIPARGDEPAHSHYDCRFVLRATDDHDYVVSDESHDLEWIALGKIHTYTDEESIMRMIRKTHALK